MHNDLNQFFYSTKSKNGDYKNLHKIKCALFSQLCRLLYIHLMGYAEILKITIQIFIGIKYVKIHTK